MIPYVLFHSFDVFTIILRKKEETRTLLLIESLLFNKLYVSASRAFVRAFFYCNVEYSKNKEKPLNE